MSAMNEKQINSRLKRGWSWKENDRAENDEGFIADGHLAIRGRTYYAAIKGYGMFAKIWYSDKVIEL